MFTRALASYDPTFPRPQTECVTIFEGQEPSSFAFSPLDGPVYYDGSCSDPANPLAARAAYSAAQIDQCGNTIKSVIGNVPAALRQSFLIAEHCALGAVYLFSDPGVVAKGDCMSTVVAAKRGCCWAEGPSK